MGTSSDTLHVSGHTQSITATITGHRHTSDSASRALREIRDASLAPCTIPDSKGHSTLVFCSFLILHMYRRHSKHTRHHFLCLRACARRFCTLRSICPHVLSQLPSQVLMHNVIAFPDIVCTSRLYDVLVTVRV